MKSLETFKRRRRKDFVITKISKERERKKREQKNQNNSGIPLRPTEILFILLQISL